jgi:hydrogenase maturation protein HypF
MVERRAIAIEGTVQGVGFRPFVHRLATRLRLGGFVKNYSGIVQIEVEGESAPVEQFLSDVVKKAPRLARIELVKWDRMTPRGERGFRIEESNRGFAGSLAISPDVATCEDCLRELFDPKDRRYRYSFLNCTNCGPRLTIVTGAPYDRAQTTMAGFAMCAACRAEYENPGDRRFHAQPTACADCGPQLKLLDGRGGPVECEDAIVYFARAMSEGIIGALKGLGGFHLVCDAKNAAAVAELRRRKHREEKPFAVMVGDIDAAERLCVVGDIERSLLVSHRRPIVLLGRRKDEVVAQAVAPGNPQMGVMLPYTPLHHLLMREMPGGVLVMTSGNRSDEPIAIEEGDALERLGGIADLFLTHDRPIHVRCDDSVTRDIGEKESIVRRSRGHAPEPIGLSWPCDPTILAVGGQLKGTFALGKGNRAILSHHLGDLDDLHAYRAFERDIRLYEKLFSLRPACIAHDLHPDYASTRYAKRRASEEGVPLVAVQHHHAHMAACMAEHELTRPVIGVTFDGTGYGTDGAIWGGEFLAGDFNDFERAARFRYVGMPGGEQAARHPWRMAAAHLMDAQAACDAFERRFPPGELRTIRQMIERKFYCPQTSSVGRLFDAVASIAGVRDSVSHEGQAAMQLEWLAASVQADGAYSFEFTGDQIDTRPLISEVVADVNTGVAASRIARRFHSTLVEIVDRVCVELRNTLNINSIILSGGAFLNKILSLESRRRLEQDGFAVYVHHKFPPGDGSLSLGQLVVAASQQRKRGCALAFQGK